MACPMGWACIISAAWANMPDRCSTCHDYAHGDVIFNLVLHTCHCICVPMSDACGKSAARQLYVVVNTQQSMFGNVYR